ncbi:MAG TPA: SDR family oxidoreductase [Candidatus Acidoferrales bacterium]|jgi:short-subunit dehydrogenase|nr:SDR family oxidoreductase [Candidatus Acidoferrales bacterium]
MNKTKQTVVITGASAGLGRAIAREFASHGAQVGLLARGKKGLEGAAADVTEAGGVPLILEADVSEADAVEKAAATVEDRFGPIDVWVNNAMASVFSPVREMMPEEYKRVTDVTYLGVVNGTLAALRRMLPRNKGKIVQVGSALAYRSIPLQSAYCAAKHAIVGFTDSLRCELIHERSRVSVTVVHMPALNTPQFEWVKSRLRNKAQPVPPIFEPEVGARAVFWAAHHDRREIYVGSSTVEAIVGNKIAPRLLDQYLGRTGYRSQQTAEPEEATRPNNLWQPVDADRDFGAHGRFDSRAKPFSFQVWADLRQTKIAAGIGMAALALGFLLRSSRKVAPREAILSRAAD